MGFIDLMVDRGVLRGIEKMHPSGYFGLIFIQYWTILNGSI